MPRPYIYINSWPGIGKHTIAKALEVQLCGVGRIVHNHQHIDLVGALLPRSSLQYQQARRDVRAVIFNSLATLPDTFNYIYIFTDCQTDNELGRSVVEEYKTAAQSRQCDFFPIVLTCDPKTNAQRIRSTERLDLVKSGKGMLVDASVLEKMRDDGSIFKADCPEILELDVTTLSPQEAASKILEHMESILKQKLRS
ncbi:hypothetical protein BKA61DRAFT_686227 [Leptodontidium sp. MPI-SDFR-AT-0119]|nr:hypothetical protein BKA61DRAFT_686227 [Leptodontidium sp. MPI-SDFR-AT-0119]